MKISVLVINSQKTKSLFIWQLILDWQSRDLATLLWTNNTYLRQNASDRSLPAKGFNISADRLAGWSYWQVPLLRLYYFFRLLADKFRRKTKKVVCLHWPEMMIVSGPARLLGLEVVWLLSTDFDLQSLPRALRGVWLRSAKKAQVVCFSHRLKNELSKHLEKDNLHVVWPGVNDRDYLYQVNLFNKLANTNESHNKAFTVATFLNNDNPESGEIILQAMKKCRGFIDSVQLIVITDKKTRQRLDWLAKKMNLSQLLWQIESQTPLNKWYLSFNLFILPGRRPDLESLSVAFGAMLNGLPVLTDKQSAVTDYFSQSDIGALLDMSDSEEISQAIIGLYQNNQIREQLSRNAKQVAARFFTFKRASRELEKFI